jgi:hypothetical protein
MLQGGPDVPDKAILEYLRGLIRCGEDASAAVELTSETVAELGFSTEVREVERAGSVSSGVSSARPKASRSATFSRGAATAAAAS